MAIQRVHYFNNQFLKQEEFRDEQSYHLVLQRALTQTLHTPGIAGDGLQVFKSGPLEITVKPGVAIDAQGRAIVVDVDTAMDLTNAPKNVPIWIAISYDEQPPPPPDPSKDIDTHMRIVEAPIVEAVTSLPADGMHIPLATFTIGAEIPGDGTTALDGDVRRAHIAGARLATGSVGSDQIAGGAVGTDALADGAVKEGKIDKGAVTRDKLGANAVTRGAILAGEIQNAALGANVVQETNLDTAVAAKLVPPDVINGLTAHVNKIDQLIGTFGILSGLAVRGLGDDMVEVDAGQAQDAAGRLLDLQHSPIPPRVPGLQPGPYDPGQGPQFTTLWVTIAYADYEPAVGIVGVEPPLDGSVVVLAKFKLVPEDWGEGRTSWSVPDGNLDGGVRTGMRTLLKGDVSVQRQLATPMWRATQVLNNRPGPLPIADVPFAWSGGTLMMFVSGSGYRNDGGGISSVVITVDTQEVGRLNVGVNDAGKHHAFIPTMLVVPPAAAPATSRTVGLAAADGGTVTDSADYFNVTVLELPF